MYVEHSPFLVKKSSSEWRIESLLRVARAFGHLRFIWIPSPEEFSRPLWRFILPSELMKPMFSRREQCFLICTLFMNYICVNIFEMHWSDLNLFCSIWKRNTIKNWWLIYIPSYRSLKRTKNIALNTTLNVTHGQTHKYLLNLYQLSCDIRKIVSSDSDWMLLNVCVCQTLILADIDANENNLSDWTTAQVTSDMTFVWVSSACNLYLIANAIYGHIKCTVN